MNKLPNGDFSLNPMEVTSAVFAFDFSPDELSQSSLAKRLRMTREQMRLSLQESGGQTAINDASKRLRQNRDIRGWLNEMTQAAKDATVDSVVTVVPASEVNTLVQAFAHLPLDEPKRAIEYFESQLPSSSRGMGMGHFAAKHAAVTVAVMFEQIAESF